MTLRTFFHRLSQHRTIRVTTEGVRFLLLTLAVGVAAVNTGNNLFYLLLAMMLSLIVLSGLLSEQSVRGLEFHRHLPDTLFVNQPATATLWIANRKSHLPSVSLRLHDVVAGEDHDRHVHLTHLAPGASTLRPYTLRITRRGRYQLDGIRVITPFPFGLFQKKAFYEQEAGIVVCPGLVALPPLLIQDLTAAGHDHAVARRGPGHSLYNLREFRPGDDSRAIHWMTTARTAKLMLKETEAEDQRLITLAVFTVAPDKEQETFEQALSIAASLIDRFLSDGLRVRLLLDEQQELQADGNETPLHLFHALALCERRPVTDETAAQHALVRALQRSQDGPTVLLSAWADPPLREMFPAVDRILTSHTHKDLFDAAGSSLSA